MMTFLLCHLRGTSQNLPRYLFVRTKATLTVGIAKETYNVWESRAPITPDQVERLRQSSHERIRFLVQPSAQRIFSNQQYQLAGAELNEDLTEADVILGVKRPKDPSDLIPRKTYVFFSHTTKGQPENMRLLQECLQKKIQLFDYEKMVSSESTSTGKVQRLVSFGRFAGMAGTMDSFHALGRRLLHRDGANTPLLACPPAMMNHTLDQARERVKQMGERIALEGMDLSEPLVIAVTGKGGTVHGGVMEILKLLPHEIVTIGDLPQLVSKKPSVVKKEPERKIYVAPIGTSDVYEHYSTSVKFDRKDFRAHPCHYQSLFASRVAPYVHCIINAVYWDLRFPRLLTKEQIRRQFERGNNRLLLLSDITCDVNGSIEFLERTTTIEEPFFHYNPLTGAEVSPGIGTSGITVLGVDILPSELPRDSSAHFGEAVSHVLEQILTTKDEEKASNAGIDTSLLSPGLAQSCLTTSDGKLESSYRYLYAMLEKAPPIDRLQRTMILALKGHLFDSGLINLIADSAVDNGCTLSFEECIIPSAKPFSGQNMSSVVLKVAGPNDDVLKAVEGQVESLVRIIQKAEATVVRKDALKPVAVKDNPVEQTVLLLGAGLVSKTVVSFLSKQDHLKIIVASDSDKASRSSASVSGKAAAVTVDVQKDPRSLSTLIEASDAVISLLPAPIHPLIVHHCLQHRKHLVTASYESDEMRSLRDNAKRIGIIILNEVGLDPGLDHMSAMKIIDDIKSRGGKVTTFSSYCGGLPSPDAANNALKYKFSWSPMGVIRASKNDARYRKDGHLCDIAGADLLSHATPFHYAWPDLALEHLPNRNSLAYEDIYNIKGAATVYRATLRYQGFSAIMDIFRILGLFEETPLKGSTWIDVMKEQTHGFGATGSLHDFLLSKTDNAELASVAFQTMERFGMTSVRPVPKSSSLVDAFCKVLESNMQYERHEHDMVLMHHTIEAIFEDNSLERHQSNLRVLGDETASAMSKTVGYTTAAATKLILDGSLKNHSGLLLPTFPAIYEPVLKQLAREGIVFDDDVFVSSRQRIQED
ncbi:alpha-aminoadipic semialdehyde synthase [Fistulifera solaris]|uniref:Alpha-aminoadipic semialdehyde synthase n=1 Tax=Fistulifera solaris TaxID=1519565 RepID=A0A1Z5JAF4_FISSO|nr:alpha-aminoadipic semialdehyde synthase [Fistulifera solaris]|eukprot:GAX10946.1 alpha-aminoadipic semialdehyde synthase [Fistulifera solaris]